MPDKTQEPRDLSPPAVSMEPLTVPTADLADEEELAKQELARIMPSKEELRKIAAKSGPLPKWLDEDEAPPF